MLSDERTAYLSVPGKPPKLMAFWCGQFQTFPLAGRQTLGRPSKSSCPDIAIPAKSVSRVHGEFLTASAGCQYRDTGSTNGTVCNGFPLSADEIHTLSDGDVLLIHGREDRQRALDVVLIYSTSYQEDAVWQMQPLTEDIAEIAVGRQETITLRDQSVSRKHASFFRASGGWAVIDHGSLNGVFVNHKRITSPVYLSQMDVIQICGYFFLFAGDRLYYQADMPQNPLEPEQAPSSPKQAGTLSIHIEERNVWHRMRKQTLLKDIRLEIAPGSMVLILGGSGAGKTTFMNAVMGYEQADGRILYDDTDIYSEYEKMKYEIGYVPQQDLLRLNDTVYATLLNAATMRLPAGLSRDEYSAAVDKTLGKFGLERERGSLVGKLSGGQRKRLSIAVEYIGNPSLFFLDEPDSGLDGTMARALMENLRTIADDGKIVLVISHSPDRAFALFDRVIVLAKDSRDNCGHLAFYGTPDDACAFFQADSLEQIVKRINRTDEGGDGLADHYIREFGKRGGI